MARATGFTCDYCRGFEAAANANQSSAELPEGWVMVRPMPRNKKVTVDKPEANILEVCGELCHAMLAVERYEAETGKRFMKSKHRAKED